MRQNVFQYTVILLASSFLFASILPTGLNAGYSDGYATDFPIDRAESICNDQIKEIGGYMKSTRIALQRHTYCSSPTRLRGVQKFISHLQGYKIGDSAQGDAIAVLLSDKRMIDTIMNGGVRTKDTGWNVITAGDGVDFGIYERNENDKYRGNSVMGIIENRGDKNPQTRYSFYVIRIVDGQFSQSIRVDTQRMNITEEEINAFRGGKTFDFNGFGKALNKAFLSGWFYNWNENHTNDIRSFSTRVYGDRVY